MRAVFILYLLVHRGSELWSKCPWGPDPGQGTSDAGSSPSLRKLVERLIHFDVQISTVPESRPPTLPPFLPTCFPSQQISSMKQNHCSGAGSLVTDVQVVPRAIKLLATKLLGSKWSFPYRPQQGLSELTTHRLSEAKFYAVPSQLRPKARHNHNATLYHLQEKIYPDWKDKPGSKKYFNIYCFSIYTAGPKELHTSPYSTITMDHRIMADVFLIFASWKHWKALKSPKHTHWDIMVPQRPQSSGPECLHPSPAVEILPVWLSSGHSSGNSCAHKDKNRSLGREGRGGSYAFSC